MIVKQSGTLRNNFWKGILLNFARNLFYGTQYGCKIDYYGNVNLFQVEKKGVGKRSTKYRTHDM